MSEAEFFIEDAPVGFFTGGGPAKAGDYRYEPYRGGGHFRLQQQLEKTGSVVCNYRRGSSKIFFVVVGCPEYGVLTLSEVQR